MNKKKNYKHIKKKNINIKIKEQQRLWDLEAEEIDNELAEADKDIKHMTKVAIIFISIILIAYIYYTFTI